MAESHHRKSHYAHEITDAFAEGYDARARAIAGAEPQNPYRAELSLIEATHAKRAPRQVENMKRDAVLWDQGWVEWTELNQTASED